MSELIEITDNCALAAYRKLRLRGLRENPEAFGETADHFESVTDQALQSRIDVQRKMGGFILCANSDHVALGTVGFSRNESEKTAHRAILWGMYVVPEARGRGIGKRLIDELIKRAEQTVDLEHICLAVVTSNKPACRLYENAGFKTYGTEPRALKVGAHYYDEYLMVRHVK